MVALRRALMLSIATFGLVACQTTTPTPVLAPDASATPTRRLPTPTPTLAASIDSPRLLAGPDGRTLAAGSLTNESEEPVQNVIVEVEFLDSSGERLGQVQVTPIPPALAAGSQAHFIAPLNKGGQPGDARASILSYAFSELEPVEFVVEIDNVQSMVGGGSRVLGTIEAPGRSPMEVLGMSIVSTRGGLPAALPETLLFPNQVRPDSLNPWMADLPIEVELEQLAVLAAGTELDPTGDDCQVEVVLAPGIQLDPQGNPFLTGRLQNQESDSCQARLLLLIELAGRGYQLIEVNSPIPLAPEETRPFGARLDRLAEAVDPEDLSVEPHLEASAWEAGPPLNLPLELTSFEQVGSTLFINGQVGNAHEFPVQRPTVFGAVRATGGDLLTAGWLPLEGPLEPGGTVDFVLPLPITGDMELGLAEFDLRALGMREGS
ncbi:MAG: FxLYD domain-containing protein [Anaerolineales bacterium]